MRLLFYADSNAVAAQCVSMAAILRKKHDYEILMMGVDAGDPFNLVGKDYELYEYRSLFEPQRLSRPAAPRHQVNDPLRDILRRVARKLRIGQIGKNLGVRSKAQLHIAYIAEIFAKFLRPIFALNTRTANYVHGKFRWLRAIAGVDLFLRQVRPDVIVLAEDNVETLTRAFVARGCALNIPTIIVPYTIPNQREPAHFYRDHRSHQGSGALARLLVAFRPKWRYAYHGRDLIRLPAARALAVEALGLSTPDPWVLNRGSAAAIALDSNAQRDLYLSLGFPNSQLYVVGDANGEVLAEGLRNREAHARTVCEAHGLMPDRPLILCGFPPDQYVGASTEEYEFSTFDEMVSEWMKMLRGIGDRANVLVRPHPRLSPAQLEAHTNEAVKLTSLPTAKLIPLADIYLASISATIRWAIASGIPVINYDTFRYHYADFEMAPGVLSVTEIGECQRILDRFVDEPAYAAELTERQRKVMSHWGLVDDKFADRMNALLKEVSNSGSGRARVVHHLPNTVERG